MKPCHRRLRYASQCFSVCLSVCLSVTYGLLTQDREGVYEVQFWQTFFQSTDKNRSRAGHLGDNHRRTITPILTLTSESGFLCGEDVSTPFFLASITSDIIYWMLLWLSCNCRMKSSECLILVGVRYYVRYVRLTAWAVRPSVRRLSSVTLVHPTDRVELFDSPIAQGLGQFVSKFWAKIQGYYGTVQVK